MFAQGDLADFTMLERSFPNARFILNTRSIGRWGQSIHQHIVCRRKMAKCMGEVGGPVQLEISTTCNMFTIE